MRILIIAALTADGYIARKSDELANWTSPEDKKHFVALTRQAGTMIMGARTFDTIGHALPGRRTIVYTTRPHDYAEMGVETTNETPAALVARLTAEGCHELAICGGGAIYDMFLRAGVVDDLYLTIEPILFGTGVTLAKEPLDISLQLVDQTMLSDNTIALHYTVKT